MSEELTTTAEDPRRGRPSASALQRLALCPASWLAGRKCDTGESTADADKGTALHLHMERGTDPADAEDLEAVTWCRETEKELRDKISPEGRTIACGREKRLWHMPLYFSGQADVIYTAGGTAFVADYKFGRGEVPPATRNLQLAALAFLVMENMPEIEKVYCTILAPFVSRTKPEVALYTREVLPALQRRIAGIIERAEAEGAPMNPSAGACKYCPAAKTCPGVSLQVERVAAASLETWAEWPESKKLQAFDLAQLAKKWAEKVERACKGDLASGQRIAGLELGSGRTSYTVTNPQAAFEILAQDLNVSPGEFAACCKVQMTALDSLVHSKLKAANPAQRVKDSKEYLRLALGDVAESKTTEGTIKRIQA